MLEPEKKYKSPLHKLVKFFEPSRDQWKEKYFQKKKQVKQLQNRVRYLERTKQEWKQKAKNIKSEVKPLEEKVLAIKKIKKKTVKTRINIEDFEIIPFHHKYSVGHMRLFFSFVNTAASSLRGGALSLEVVNNFFKLSLEIPSWHSARLWLLRLGYYKLMRPKIQANDWIWIVDHNVQLGCEKNFVILGIRLCNLPPVGECVKPEDIEPIDLSPVVQSNGEIVFQQLEENIAKTGVPKVIVADQGSDLKAGIDRFCKIHPETKYIYDIKPKTASILKAELQNEEAWIEFKSLASKTKNQLQLSRIKFFEKNFILETPLAHHCPPNQRTKARYMNVDKLVKWAYGQLKFLQQTETKPEKLIEKLFWLWDYQEKVEEWNQLINEVTSVENFVKKPGLTTQSHSELSKQLETELSCHSSPRVLNVRSQLLDFVKEQASNANIGERLLGSSEVIESVFGKPKRLEQEQSKSGFTGLVLGIAAMVSTTTSEIFKKAMETVPTKMVLAWCKEHIGSSVQAKKIEMLEAVK